MLNSLACFKTLRTSCLCYFYTLYFTKDYPLVGRELRQSLGDGEEQGSLACCSPQSHEESDTTW